VVAALHASANQIALGTPGAFEPQGGGGYEQASLAPAVSHSPVYEPPPQEPAYEAPAYQAPAAAAAFAAPAPEPKRAAVSKREARARDLFATNAGEEMQTSAPAAPHAMAPAGGGGADGLTGQRNENSVLFSLAVLTKNADERPPVDTGGAANKEDSGLIDLKALAAKAESMRPPAMHDDGVFHAPLGFTPPLGAPVGALSGGGETQAKSKLPLYIGGGAGVLVLLVLGIVIGVKIAGSPAPVPVASVLSMPTAPTAEPSAVASAPTAEPSASAAPSATVAATVKKAFGGGGTYRPPGAGGSKPPTAGGSSGGAAPTPSPTPKKSGGDCGCNGDLMCLMKCSTH
jgi:hypothetical protein